MQHEEFIRAALYTKYKQPEKYINTTLQQQFDKQYNHTMDMDQDEKDEDESDIVMDEEKDIIEYSTPKEGQQYIKWCQYVKGGRYGQLKALTENYFKGKKQSFVEDPVDSISVDDFIIKYVRKAQHIKNVITKHVSPKAWKKTPSFKKQPILSTLQSLGFAVYKATNFFQPYYAFFLLELTDHMMTKFADKGKTADQLMYEGGPGIFQINFMHLMFDQRIQFLASLLYSHPVYKELTQLYPTTSIKLLEFGLACLIPHTTAEASHGDFEKVPTRGLYIYKIILIS